MCFMAEGCGSKYTGDMDMDALDGQKIIRIVDEFGYAAGEDEEFLQGLGAGLLTCPEIGEEFLHYVETGDFSCKAKVEGYTVVDIMVWQIDHFKAEMDRGLYGMKHNGSKMVLRAFDTMLKMRKEPEKYRYLMQTETGTDYPEKY
ncbi:hypothetical protein D3Z45_03695 [Lachnospiraceae bacterium]|nr:hypothetical protein [Lachnospiraceae bacterium]